MVRFFCALVLVVIESTWQLFTIPLISLEETNGKMLLTKIRLGPIMPRFGLRGSAPWGRYADWSGPQREGALQSGRTRGEKVGTVKWRFEEQSKERVGTSEELNHVYYMYK